jgi:fatty-acyl-CoA synthase
MAEASDTKPNGVTYMCGPPTVLNMLVNAPAEQRRRLNHSVDVLTGGSPPPVKVIKGMEEFGFHVTHVMA